jgi:hypothetical protein
MSVIGKLKRREFTMKFQIPTETLFLYGVPFGGDNEPTPPPGQQPSVEGNPPGAQPNPVGTGQGTPSPNPPAADSGDEDDDEFKSYTPAELRRLAKDLKAGKTTAEQAAKDAQAKIDAEERKKRTDLENLQTDKTRLEGENTSLRATIAELAIIGAIRDETKYDWHNPNTVAGLLNPEIVKVGDDGKVEGLKKELDRVAKDHAYLLKTPAQQQQQQPPGVGQQQWPGATGFQPGTGGANNGGGQQQPNVADLAKTYPALASRM